MKAYADAVINALHMLLARAPQIFAYLALVDGDDQRRSEEIAAVVLDSDNRSNAALVVRICYSFPTAKWRFGKKR